MAFDAVSMQRYPEVERINHVHTPGNSSGIVDGAAGVPDRHPRDGRGAGPEAPRTDPRGGLHRLGALHHADGPGAGHAQAP
jgi:acetyl-CoA C-acetyltransferase